MDLKDLEIEVGSLLARRCGVKIQFLTLIKNRFHYILVYTWFFCRPTGLTRCTLLVDPNYYSYFYLYYA